MSHIETRRKCSESNANFVTVMKIRLLILIFLVLFHTCVSQTRESCFSPVYCQGELLDTVQRSRIFNDSKTFVDLAMKNSVNETLQRFRTMMAETDNEPTQEHVRAFVSENFRSVGELEDIVPPDFKKEPKIVKEISDPVVRNFATKIISIWPSLTRKVSQQVFDHPDTYSIIPVPHRFIIPGGRFKEFYYWDAYWIIKGLLLSDMFDTARCMVENLLSVVEKFGFIPNGGRIYYLNRSQPPLLTLMVSDYVKYTNDYEFLGKHIQTLEKELHFWLTKRITEVDKNGQTYILAHYDSESDTPRPESYMEDIEACEMYEGEDKYECYADIKSGAESGWDFASRWIFGEDEEPSSAMSHIQTRRVIPVDLSSFLYKSFTTMVKFCSILQKTKAAEYWTDIAEKWKNAVENIHYNEEDGIWYDYDNKLSRQRRQYYASNFTPLWAGAMDDSVREIRASRAVDYLRQKGILNFRGGIPMTLLQTGLQWDMPNAWSPLQSLTIIGLHKCGNEEVKEVAKQLAYVWINSNIRAFHDNKVMFEKYDALHSGQFGGGGEYQVQAGFGWSNGCVLELIDLYFRTKTRKYKGGFDD